MNGIGDFDDKDHAAVYGNFRPVYPETVSEIISSYMESNSCSGVEAAVDVCCGSGQSTMLLSHLFQRVRGVDKSLAQITQANAKHENSKNVCFNVGDAQNLEVESSSVDLLTCAMGWHWLDPDTFYHEAKRVLKPRGCIAVYGYNTTVNDNDRVGAVVDAFKGELMEKGCIDERALHTFNEYRDVHLPFSHVQRLNFDLPQKASVDQLFGFFESITSYRAYCNKYPGNALLETLRGGSNWQDRTVLEFSYPGFIILGVKEN